MAMKLKAGDTATGISGKDKGKTGKIIRVEPSKDRVYGEGVHLIQRQTRPNPARPNAQVGVIEREGPVHVSNVALLDPKGRKATRVGTRRTEDGKRMRVTKSSGTEID